MRYSRADFKSDNPIDVIVNAQYASLINVDGFRVSWKREAVAALVEATRIEIFYNSHLAPLDVDPLVLSYLKREPVDLDDMDERLYYLTLSGSKFYKYVLDLFEGEYRSSRYRATMLDIFVERKRDNSALDLHLRALKLYFQRDRDLESVIRVDRYLEGSQRREYFRRVALTSTYAHRLVTDHGWKPHAELK